MSVRKAVNAVYPPRSSRFKFVQNGCPPVADLLHHLVPHPPKQPKGRKGAISGTGTCKEGDLKSVRVSTTSRYIECELLTSGACR
jgi:hypothetical protein